MWWCFKKPEEEKPHKREVQKVNPPPSFTIHEENLPWIAPMNDRSFDNEKLKLFDEFNIPSLTCNQLALTLRTIDFSKTKKDFCHKVMNKISDVENYKIITENQTFWDKKDLEIMFKEEIIRRRAFQNEQISFE